MIPKAAVAWNSLRLAFGILRSSRASFPPLGVHELHNNPETLGKKIGVFEVVTEICSNNHSRLMVYDVLETIWY